MRRVLVDQVVLVQQVCTSCALAVDEDAAAVLLLELGDSRR